MRVQKITLQTGSETQWTLHLRTVVCVCEVK